MSVIPPRLDHACRRAAGKGDGRSIPVVNAIYTALDFTDQESEESKKLTDMADEWQERLAEARVSLLLLRPTTAEESLAKAEYLRTSEDMRDFGSYPASVADIFARVCAVDGARDQVAA